jgi:Domain of unknown function (DUF6531)
MVSLSPARKRWALLAAVVVGSLTVQSLPAGAQAPPPRAARPVAVAAPPGAGPVDRPLPPDAAVDRALPGAPRPPAVPPAVAAAGAPHRLSAAERAAAPRPAAPKSANPRPADPKKPHADDGGGGDPATGAQKVTLRPGFALGDTSVVLYFDAADPGVSAWSSWQATVYDVATSTAQLSVPLAPSEAKPCAALRQFCRTFGAADGWALVPDRQYFATVTVTLADGTQVTSAPSDAAKARGTIVPPAIPDQQAAGCACGDVLYPATPGQAVRGSGVNTGTGSFTWSDTDLQLASFGEPFVATRTYSSATATAGSLGIGWTWSLDVRVIPPAGDATAVTVRAEDGAQAVFTRNADGSYARPPNVRATLSAVPGGGWKLVTPDQRTFGFDATGRLASVQNSRGFGLTIAYTAAKWTVTDAAGHKVTVDVGSDGLVTKITLPDGHRRQQPRHAVRLRRR